MSHIDLTSEAVAWFDMLPSPIWVFDRSDLSLIAANAAACSLLGYEWQELSGRTIADIRPPEDREAIRAAVAAFDGPSRDAGHWRLLTAQGGEVCARFHWQAARYEGRDVVLASIRDESALAGMSGRARAAPDRARRAEARTDLAIEEFQQLFQASPYCAVALRPGDLEVVAATDDYLSATGTTRDSLIGRPLPSARPDDPADPEADTTADLRASLNRVELLRKTDVMPVQRHAVRRPDGSVEERFRTLVNHPVTRDDGSVAFIIHRVDDITDLIGTGVLDAPDGDGGVPIAERLLAALSELQKLRALLNRSQQQEARLRTAEHLLKVGAWDFDFETRQTHWSPEVYRIYGCPGRETPPDGDAYLALVHPDDRDEVERAYNRFYENGDRYLHFQHRILGDDGTIRHVRGVGERHEHFGQEMVLGFVQDITTEVTTARDLSRAQALVRLAGEKAQVGGWRVDLDGPEIIWSDETAEIHERPPGYQPSLQEAIDYYEGEYRDRIARDYQACAEEGRPFDIVGRFRTARDNLIWVRSIGEAVRDDSGRIVAVQGAFQNITALVEAQTLADRIHKQLVDTLEHISDAFLTLDRDWRITYVNRQAQNVLRRDRDDMIGGNLWELFPEAAGTEFEAQYRHAIETGEVVRFREYFEPLDLLAEVNAYPVPSGLAVYFRDVGESVRQEERLKLLETAVARMTDLLVITEAEPLDGPDGPRIIYVNEAFERLTGYPPEEVIGDTPRLLHGPDTDREELTRIRESLEKGRPVRAQVKNYTKAGEPIWLELDIAPLENAAGVTTHFVAIQRDVTERIRTARQLAESEERFRLISRASSDVIWDWQIATDLFWLSENYEEVFLRNIDGEPRTFEASLARIHPDDQDRVRRSIFAALESDTDSWSGEYRVSTGTGGYKTVEDRAFIIRDNDGKAVRMVAGMTDVTKVRELDRQFREAQKMEVVGKLTGGVAHDFNNLLTIILGSAEELSNRLAGDPTLRDLADMTVTAAERGADLTNRLLSFARRQTLAPEVIDLNAQIANLDGLLRRILPENVSFGIVEAEGLWRTEVDPTQLDNAILNLAINARDAMPEGGALMIETANVTLDQDYADLHPDVVPGSYVMVSVSDSGTGMDADTRARAFEPFFTTKPMGQGSGLGLSTVFGFTKQSRGHVNIYSEVGEGTAVKLYFPRATGQAPADAAADGERHGTGGSERILVVEDDAMVRMHLERQLRSLGYDVTAEESGTRALRLIEEEQARFDLLLSDVVMPGGINGQELADAACAIQPDLKVLFTSGYTDNALRHQGRLRHGVHILPKPYRRHALARKVREVLDG